MVNTTLGIDIGGSAVKGALVNTDIGELASERIRKVTREPLKPKEIVGLIATIQKELKYTGPIGAGFPGIIRHGIVCSSANLHKNWVGEDCAPPTRAVTPVMANPASATHKLRGQGCWADNPEEEKLRSPVSNSRAGN